MSDMAALLTNLTSQNMKTAAPGARLFTMRWLRLLNTLPDFRLLRFLPGFLEYLLKFLSDPDKRVSAEAEKLLDIFLEDLSVDDLKVDNVEVLSPLKSDLQIAPEDYCGTKYERNSGGGFHTILKTLIDFASSCDEIPLAVSLKWIARVTFFLNWSILAYVSVILSVLLDSMSHRSHDILFIPRCYFFSIFVFFSANLWGFSHHH